MSSISDQVQGGKGGKPPGRRTAPPRMYNTDELMSLDLPPPRWSVPGLVPEGATILAGPPKSGKSWLALDVSLAVALGALALGSIPAEQGEVLYLALEDGERRLRGRLRKLLGPGGKLPTALTLAFAWPRADQGGLDDLRAWLDARPGVRLVVVDTFAKVRPRSRHAGVDYQRDYDAGAEFKALADERRLSLLINHHTRKMFADDPLEMVSGSTGLTGAVDAALVLLKPRDLDDAPLHIIGRDFEDDDALALRFDRPSARWRLLGKLKDHPELKAGSKEQKEMLGVFKARGRPVKIDEAAKALGKTYEATKMQMSRMAQRGLVISLGAEGYILTPDG